MKISNFGMRELYYYIEFWRPRKVFTEIWFIWFRCMPLVFVSFCCFCSAIYDIYAFQWWELNIRTHVKFGWWHILKLIILLEQEFSVVKYFPYFRLNPLLVGIGILNFQYRSNKYVIHIDIKQIWENVMFPTCHSKFLIA